MQQANWIVYEQIKLACVYIHVRTYFCSGSSSDAVSILLSISRALPLSLPRFRNAWSTDEPGGGGGGGGRRAGGDGEGGRGGEGRGGEVGQRVTNATF